MPKPRQASRSVRSAFAGIELIHITGKGQLMLMAKSVQCPDSIHWQHKTRHIHACRMAAATCGRDRKGPSRLFRVVNMSPWKANLYPIFSDSFSARFKWSIIFGSVC